ncbi:MAG TPA: hypothetical protein VGS07_13815 [Thermoanaerobaculia bacterium]|jgi:hypothetical protein|nr:hypothetical protein [Thermoanaerobaculia bacterium]
MNDLQFQNNWVHGKTWLIESVNGDPRVRQGDIVQFTTAPKRIQIQRANLPPEVWSTSCAIAGDSLVGINSDNKIFRIQQNSPTRISCQLVDALPRLPRLLAAGLSAFLGALVGAVTGFFAGFPVDGTLIGIVAALTGSVVMAITDKYTSAGTWVADDGSAGNVVASRPASRIEAVRA